MKILVTGGAGYIGSACVSQLVAEGHEVVVFDDLSSGQGDKVVPGARLVVGNLLNEESLHNLCSEGVFDAVIHCAAKKAVGESEQNPDWYFDNNVAGSLNLLKFIAKTGVKHLIFSSTAAVYAPVTNSDPITEANILRPASVYGTTKLMVELLIQEYARVGKLPRFTILRYFNVAGDGGLIYKETKAENVFPLLAKSVVNGTTFNIYGDDYETRDGTAIRDYIHLNDLVSAHILALNSDISGIFNLGTGTGYTVSELVEAFSSELGRPVDTKVVDRRPGDVPVVVAGAELAKRHLAWEPKYGLGDMVKDTLRVYGIK